MTRVRMKRVLTVESGLVILFGGPRVPSNSPRAQGGVGASPYWWEPDKFISVARVANPIRLQEVCGSFVKAGFRCDSFH